jgi:zinc D-Ala-D-Ala dipeptidase
MKFVDLEKYGLLVEPRYYYFGWTKEPRVLGRKSAVKALLRAQKLLPKGYKFKVWDMQRTRDVQIKMLGSFKRRIDNIYKHLPAKKRQELLYTFGGKPLPDKILVRPDCHRNGGSVDLTIMDPKGNELYMGTDHDDLTRKAFVYHFHKLKNPSALDLLAKKNRNILINAMQGAGWEIYKYEWWHWSTKE